MASLEELHQQELETQSHLFMMQRESLKIVQNSKLAVLEEKQKKEKEKGDFLVLHSSNQGELAVTNQVLLVGDEINQILHALGSKIRKKLKKRRAPSGAKVSTWISPSMWNHVFAFLLARGAMKEVHVVVALLPRPEHGVSCLRDNFSIPHSLKVLKELLISGGGVQQGRSQNHLRLPGLLFRGCPASVEFGHPLQDHIPKGDSMLPLPVAGCFFVQ